MLRASGRSSHVLNGKKYIFRWPFPKTGFVGSRLAVILKAEKPWSTESGTQNATLGLRYQAGGQCRGTWRKVWVMYQVIVCNTVTHADAWRIGWRWGLSEMRLWNTAEVFSPQKNRWVNVPTDIVWDSSPLFMRSSLSAHPSAFECKQSSVWSQNWSMYTISFVLWRFFFFWKLKSLPSSALLRVFWWPRG